MYLALLTVFAGATIVPVVEELMFRGVLLRLWMTRFGYRRGIIATAIPFGALHQDPIGAVAFAIVLSVLYLRSGSLVVGISIHALSNLIAGLAAIFDRGEQTLAEINRLFLPSSVVIAGCVLLLILAFRLPWGGVAGERPALAAPSV